MSLPLDPQSVPEDVRRAAETVRVWAESQDLKYWQLGGVCDRRFAQGHEAINSFLANQRSSPPDIRNAIQENLFKML